MMYEEAKSQVKKYSDQVLGTPLIDMFGDKVLTQPVTHIVIAQMSFLKEAILKMELESITNEQAIQLFTHLQDDFDVFVVSRPLNGDGEYYHNLLEIHLKKMGVLG